MYKLLSNPRSCQVTAVKVGSEQRFCKDQPSIVTQIKVRTELRGGQRDISSCERNVRYWQSEYRKWYNEARRKGYL